MLYNVNEVSNKGNWIFFRHHYTRSGYGTFLGLTFCALVTEGGGGKDESKEHSKWPHTL